LPRILIKIASKEGKSSEPFKNHLGNMVRIINVMKSYGQTTTVFSPFKWQKMGMNAHTEHTYSETIHNNIFLRLFSKFSTYARLMKTESKMIKRNSDLCQS
jgi:hypothetical protein